MDLTLVLAQKIGGLAIIIALGFLSVRLKILNFDDTRPLNKFALYFLTPCAMLDAYQYEFSMDKLAGMGIALLGSLVVVVVFAVLPVLDVVKVIVVPETSAEYVP